VAHSAPDSRDLVVVVLAGVQRFIAESRSTADLHAGSTIISTLAQAMVEQVPEDNRVFPAGASTASTPNRVVAQAPAAAGTTLARRMAEAARAEWRTYDPAQGSHGFPTVQWVVVPPEPCGYAAQWERAGRALAARKRIRDFTFPPMAQTRVCALTGRWAAVTSPPKGAYNVRENEVLSAVGHAKRAFSRKARQGFPSTWSIAAAPFRAGVISAAAADPRLLQRVTNLRDAVELLIGVLSEDDRKALERTAGTPPGMPHPEDDRLRWFREAEGGWCVPEFWEPAGLARDYALSQDPEDGEFTAACGLARGAANALVEAVTRREGPPLSPYLAVLAQDADHMGAKLGSFPQDQEPRGWHLQVSGLLAEASERQTAAIESQDSKVLGRVVYAGGDDLLALVPAGSALRAAMDTSQAFVGTLQQAVAEPTCSTAVVFFHASWPLQSAVVAAQRLLEEAKAAGRPGLGVAVMRRSGERNRVILPWLDPSDGRTPMAEHVLRLVTSLSGPSSGALSGRLATGLERDRRELATLGPEWLAWELARRAVRHGADPVAGRALLALSYELADGRRDVPDAAVLIARFLAAETAAGAAA